MICTMKIKIGYCPVSVDSLSYSRAFDNAEAKIPEGTAIIPKPIIKIQKDQTTFPTLIHFPQLFVLKWP